MAGPDARSPAVGVAPHAAALAWFLLLAALLSWPLALYLTTHVPGAGPGDNLAFVWNFWWARLAVRDPDAALFFTDRLFAPFGSPLALHTHTALPALIGATILAPLPVTAAHNLVLIAGLAGNGICAYVLALHQLRRALPAALAGTLFAASTFVSIRMLGHFNLVHAWGVPLALWCWARCVERPTAWRGAAWGTALAAVLYTDYYLFVYVVVASGLWWLFSVREFSAAAPRRLPRWLTGTFVAAFVLIAGAIAAVAITGGFRLELGPIRLSASQLRNPVAALWIVALLWLAGRLRLAVRRSVDARPFRAYLPSMVGALVVAPLLALPLLLASGQLVAAGGYASPPQSWRSGPRGVDVLTVVAGNPLNPLSGALTRSLYRAADIDLMEQAAWFGIAAIAAVVLGTARGALRDPAAARWWALAAAFLIWSLGAYLRVGGFDTGIPLPQAVTRLVPILSNARIPGRAVIMVQLALAMLAGLAAARLRWNGRIVALLAAIAVVDGTAGAVALYELPQRDAVDGALATADRRQGVVELPTGLRDGFGQTGRFDHRALVHQMWHGRPIAGGFVARLSPRVREQVEAAPALVELLRLSAADTADVLDGLPHDLASGLLSLGITHVVVNRDALPFDPGPALEARGLRPLAASGTRMLYAVGGGP